MTKKYEFTGETKELNGVILRRIRRISDGLIGGWIEKEENLSQEGNAFVFDNAFVYGNARVSGNACVYDNARVSGNARVFGTACVYDNACVYGTACVHGDACVYGNARVSGKACVHGDARVSGDAVIKSSNDIVWFSKVGSENGTLTAYRTETGIDVTRGCYHGSLDEFAKRVKEVHGDNQHGRSYMVLIEAIRIKLSGTES